MKLSGLWLPCGVQNFHRISRNSVEPTLLLAGETTFVQRLKATTDEVIDPICCGSRNMFYAWFKYSGQQVYADSDGFVVSIGDNPRIPDLAPPEYWVPRSKLYGGLDANTLMSRASADATLVPAPWLLTNFQANLLLEGVWNSALDPRVFLLSDANEAQELEKEFTIAKLLSEITIEFEYTGNLHRHDVDSKKPLDVVIRRDIFLQAVRSMRNDHLLPLKWDIEATRRHLFSETMTMLHRPESLNQYSPIAQNRRDELFTRSSDEQLRGYVMLVSAKLPLVDNLTFLLEDCWDGLAVDSLAEGEAEGPIRTVSDVVGSWKGTEQALHKNVEALERSFSNIWQDRLLHETEQVRVEEEALGELQREQARDKSARWVDTLIFVITLAVAFAALYFSIGGAEVVKHHQNTVWEIAILIVVTASVLFGFGPRIFGRIMGEFGPRFEQVTRLDEPLKINRNGDPGVGHDWMDLPIEALHRAHTHLNGYPVDVLGRRKFSTKRMHEWLGLKCSFISDSEKHVKGAYPVGVHVSEKVPRMRVDSPSTTDTYVRMHTELKLMLPRMRWRIMACLLNKPYRSVIKHPTGWKNRFMGTHSATFPKRCVTANCAVELHKHSPDPIGPYLYFLREMRLIVSSRAELTRNETLLITHLVDAILVEPWVEPYEKNDERRSKVNLSLLTDRLGPPEWKIESLKEPKG